MRQTVLTDTAKADVEPITRFVGENVSQKAKINFLTAFAERLLLIEKIPFLYQASDKNPDVRRCLIHKHVACYYKVKDDLILILAVVDTRINPDNSPY